MSGGVELRSALALMRCRVSGHTTALNEEMEETQRGNIQRQRAREQAERQKKLKAMPFTSISINKLCSPLFPLWRTRITNSITTAFPLYQNYSQTLNCIPVLNKTLQN